MIAGSAISDWQMTNYSLKDLELREKAGDQHKQKLKQKIAGIKAARKDRPITSKTDFISEYKELADKLNINLGNGGYFRHRPPSLGFIEDTPQTMPLNRIGETSLGINPALNRLRYSDYQKIALVQKSQEIAFELIRSRVNGNDNAAETYPAIAQSLSEMNSLEKIGSSISYDTEEFNNLHNAVLQNFEHIYPDFERRCRETYKENKNNAEPDIALSAYQRYCLFETPGFIPNLNSPDIIHDMYSKEETYNQTLQRIRQNDNSNAVRREIGEHMIR